MPQDEDEISLLTPDFKVPDPFDLPDADRPKAAIVREVDLSSNPSRISAKFSRANRVENVPTMGEFRSLLAQIGSGNYRFPRPIPAEPRTRFKTPLSLYNDGYHYIIYILNDDKNWEFSSTLAPITVESVADGQYYEAAHVYPDGRIKGTPGEKCIAAYFIAKAPVDDVTGEPADYDDSVNLHVDLLYEDHDGAPTRMPLVIDPDVRYPGGSGSP